LGVCQEILGKQGILATRSPDRMQGALKTGLSRIEVDQTYGLRASVGERLGIAGTMQRRLAETSDHNLRHGDPERRRMQRAWQQQNIPPHLVSEAVRRTSEIAVRAGRQN
jgi:hypothetical protein